MKCLFQLCVSSIIPQENCFHRLLQFQPHFESLQVHFMCYLKNNIKKKQQSSHSTNASNHYPSSIMQQYRINITTTPSQWLFNLTFLSAYQWIQLYFSWISDFFPTKSGATVPRNHPYYNPHVCYDEILGLVVLV